MSKTSKEGDPSDQKASEKLVSRPGKHYPRGATYDGEGVNFALLSENAMLFTYAYTIPLTPPAKPTALLLQNGPNWSGIFTSKACTRPVIWLSR